jgi:hypothetical protein
VVIQDKTARMEERVIALYERVGQIEKKL